MDKTVVILRGVSNAEKTTFANFIGGDVCSADDFFTDETGEYKFDASKLSEAHEYCFDKFKKLIDSGSSRIIISNTNTQYWEFKRYKEYAEEKGYIVFCTILENRHGNRNNHDVPDLAIERQKARFEVKL